MFLTPLLFLANMLMKGLSGRKETKEEFSYYWKEYYPTILDFYKNDKLTTTNFNQWKLLESNLKYRNIKKDKAERLIMFFSKGDKIFNPFRQTKNIKYFN